MTVRAVVMPIRITNNAQGGPKFNTTINETASGFEFRNIDWARQRCEYDISYGIRTQADADEARSLFYASMGRAYGFLFYDWNDHSIGTSVLGQALGTGTSFQIFKRYTYGAFTYDRIITRPAAEGNGEIVWVDGSPIAASGYTIDTTTGELEVSVGGAVAIYLPTFYVPVRFDQDEFPQIVFRPGIVETPAIKLVEIKEEGVVA